MREKHTYNLYVPSRGLESPRTNAERTAATRAALIAAARQLFEERTYDGTSTSDIVRAAGVTRGALYHHFEDKRDLLRAVFIEIQEEVAQRVLTSALAHDDPWEFFVAGWMAFLDVTETPTVRLLMIDAPAALGVAEWTAIDDLYCLQPAIAGLEHLVRNGVVAEQPLEPLGRVLLTASNALAGLIAASEDPEVTRATVVPIWRRMLEAVKAAPD